MSFSKDFIWGAATASYQIEGAAYKDGKGLSIWDTCCKHPGLVYGGHTGDVACDHYHRYPEDVQLMKELGINAYRLSLSWPRILPDGTGAVSEKGLDFYDRLLDQLSEQGIAPYVTLYHWDLPYELYKRGGWLNREIVDWFADYTRIVIDRYSDRVAHWMTINEPQIFIGLGLESGVHAPFLKLPRRDVLTAAHNVLLAHGKSVQVIRAFSKQKAAIGFAPIGAVRSPISESPDDIEAARSEMFRTDTDSIINSAWWSDPIFFGNYPEDGLRHHQDHMPRILSGDMEIISQPLDFYGVNIYDCARVKAGPSRKPEYPDALPGSARTAFNWPVVPESLYWGSKFLYERYQKPIIITENGLASMDWICEDGKVHDVMRIDFLSRYLHALERASQDGVDIHGYFAWSLLDNFEWAEGYEKRFGLIHVDFDTLKRTPKDSFYWYQNFIKQQRV